MKIHRRPFLSNGFKTNSWTFLSQCCSHIVPESGCPYNALSSLTTGRRNFQYWISGGHASVGTSNPTQRSLQLGLDVCLNRICKLDCVSGKTSVEIQPIVRHRRMQVSSPNLERTLLPNVGSSLDYPVERLFL